MKLYEVYEDENSSYYICAENETEALDEIRKELIREGRDKDDIEKFIVDKIDISKPRIISVNSIKY